MKVNTRANENTTIYAGGDDAVLGKQTVRNRERNGKSDGRSKAGTIFAGDLGIGGDAIALKRQTAQKKALKVVSDAWNADYAIDDEVKLHRENAERFRADRDELNSLISDIRGSEKLLQEQYGVADDSEEQKDAELLMKWKEIQGGAGGSRYLSKEEGERVRTLMEEGLTDYQTELLEMHEGTVIYMVQSNELDLEIEQENKIISGIRRERLKHDPMVGAQKEAEQIMESAGKEILGMLFDEGKEHIDEEQKEEQEKAQEAKEKKEEQEELIEKRKEEKEDAEELTEEILEGTKSMSGKTIEEVKQEVKDIVAKMKLVEEDIKGAKVDESL